MPVAVDTQLLCIVIVMILPSGHLQSKAAGNSAGVHSHSSPEA